MTWPATSDFGQNLHAAVPSHGGQVPLLNRLQCAAQNPALCKMPFGRINESKKQSSAFFLLASFMNIKVYTDASRTVRTPQIPKYRLMPVHEIISYLLA